MSNTPPASTVHPEIRERTAQALYQLLAERNGRADRWEIHGEHFKNQWRARADAFLSAIGATAEITVADVMERGLRLEEAMGHDTQVTTEHIAWFAGYGPLEVVGKCDHDCAHRGQKVVAWGPSMTYYELCECTECGCRAWTAALSQSHGGIRDSHPFLKLAQPTTEDES